MYYLLKNFIRGILIILVIPALALCATPGQSLAKSRVLVKYFHGNVRCETCLEFESWAKTAVDGFPGELADGTLQWQLINFDKPENQHYIKDYDLVEKSLVLVREEDGQPVHWKNVEEFWDYSDDQKAEFVSLVRGMIQDYLKN